MRWDAFARWSAGSQRSPTSSSCIPVDRATSGGRFLVDMRFDKVKGRELFATCDIKPHTPLFRITPSAVLQSVDAVHPLTPLRLSPWGSSVAAAAGEVVVHAASWGAAFEALCTDVDEMLSQARCMARKKRTAKSSVLDVVDVSPADVEAWLLAAVVAREFVSGEASPYYGYLRGCLPRSPLPTQMEGWRVLAARHLVPLSAYYGLSDVADGGTSVLDRFELDVEASEQWKMNVSKSIAARLILTGGPPPDGFSSCLPQVVRWAFDCVRSRAHPFSFHTRPNLFSPRRYPLSPNSRRETQVHPLFYSLTLCPWFDMINDGPATNIDFVDTPSLMPMTAAASSSRCDHRFLLNRDLLIEAGPQGLRRGQALSMSYAACRTRRPLDGRGNPAASSCVDQRIDVPSTLLKFGFLPSEGSSVVVR